MVTILLLAAAAATPSAPPRQACEAQLRQADRRQAPGGIRKLGELPPANQVLTVYREVDGCPKPVIVRREIGAK